MKQYANLFKNGRSQAVRLPVNFKFDCDKVEVTRNEETGAVTLTPCPRDWSGFVEYLRANPLPEGEYFERPEQLPESTRELF